MRSSLLACLLAFALATPASAKLNEFSVADGYMNPFATPVWTYNSFWTFEGGSINSNYVAQHGYGAGFPFGEPFALVVRNDNAAGSYQFRYDFEAFDLAGVNPNAPGANRIAISFDVCSVVSQNSATENNAAMLTMKFGGTRANPGVTLGFSDGNKLMYSDAFGNLLVFPGYTLNAYGWDRITLVLDFFTYTYDLTLESMSGSSPAASNTWTPTTSYPIAIGMPFTNPATSIPSLYFETFTDPENNLGWHKTFFDNFDGRLDGAVPVESSSWGRVKTLFR